jgi:hypothetical protein
MLTYFAFPGGGFSAPVQLSDKLSEFFDGEITLPRSEVFCISFPSNAL